MDFVVLARKLRPSRFEHLIGQDTIVRALRNALRTDRVAHAFLFAGSRGVGKTSTARILTKALNCENPQDGEPCNACDSCREITLNTSPDVYEIDAASNRGIDNIRELRENTKYAPVKGRFKTYIIDEAHMLTTESFNALLKTLEEPPPHVKFILATTNPHRIPETILSRCQRYDFARVPVARLADYLQQVSGDEGLTLSRRALETVARNAAGGVRDALTALDQVVSFAGQEASDAQVLSILGLADEGEVLTLLGAILDGSLSAAMDAFAATRERGHDLSVLLQALIREVKDLSLYVALEGRGHAFAEHPPETLAFYAERGGQVTLDALQQLFYLLLEVEDQLRRSDFAQACFEMGLIKACRVEPLIGVSELLADVRALGGGAGSAPAAGRSEPPATARPVPSATAPAPVATPTVLAAPPTAAPATAPIAAAPAATTGSAPRTTGAPPKIAQIAARAQARAREGGGVRREAASPRSGEDADEGEPGPPADSTASPPDAGATTPAPASPASPPRAPTSPAPERPAPPEAHGANGRAPHDEVGALRDEVDAPPMNDAEPAEDAEPALCDDPRWRRFVEELGTRQRTLAAKLRAAEVRALESDAVEVLPADGHNRPSAAELDAAAPVLREAFGDAFRIRLAGDSLGKARPAHSIAGRNRLLERARAEARRAAAEADPQVQRLLHFLPQGRIVEVALSEEPRDPAHPNRSDDV